MRGACAVFNRAVHVMTCTECEIGHEKRTQLLHLIFLFLYIYFTNGLLLSIIFCISYIFLFFVFKSLIIYFLRLFIASNIVVPSLAGEREITTPASVRA